MQLGIEQHWSKSWSRWDEVLDYKQASSNTKARHVPALTILIVGMGLWSSFDVF